MVANLRLSFVWAGSAGVWGLMSIAAEHAHSNTSLTDAAVLPEGAAKMTHVRITELWEVGKPTQNIPGRLGLDRQREGGVCTLSLPRYTASFWEFLFPRVFTIPRHIEARGRLLPTLPASRVYP